MQSFYRRFATRSPLAYRCTSICPPRAGLSNRDTMSGKRGPLDRYFTAVTGPNSKKQKPDPSVKAAGKDENRDPTLPAAGKQAPLDNCCIGQAPGKRQQDQPKGSASDSDSNPAIGKAAAGHTKLGSSPTSQQAMSVPAEQAGASSKSPKATSSSLAAANASAATGALGALMSAARGQAQQILSSADSRKQLSIQEMQQLAESNQAAAQAVVQASEAAGQQPKLQALLVEPSWLEVLAAEFDKPYMQQVQSFLEKEWANNVVYPPKASIFRAFNEVPFDQVRVVILGQDPYINAGEAMGLSFSVPPGVKIPPSLQNMYKELEADLGCTRPNNGCLEKWCRQGVLLLNASLTVQAGKSNSHAGKGWEGLTSAALQALASKRSGIVFLLWGKFAQDRCAKLDMRRHHVLKSVHPSPLSARRGFLGCKHFSITNKLLQQSGLPAIDWQIDNV